MRNRFQGDQWGVQRMKNEEKKSDNEHNLFVLLTRRLQRGRGEWSKRKIWQARRNNCPLTSLPRTCQARRPQEWFKNRRGGESPRSEPGPRIGKCECARAGFGECRPRLTQYLIPCPFSAPPGLSCSVPLSQPEKARARQPRADGCLTWSHAMPSDTGVRIASQQHWLPSSPLRRPTARQSVSPRCIMASSHHHGSTLRPLCHGRAPLPLPSRSSHLFSSRTSSWGFKSSALFCDALLGWPISSSRWSWWAMMVKVSLRRGGFV